MATLSSAGIGSGLNVESIITDLMKIERQPVTRLQSQQNTLQSKISAMGTVKSAVSSLQTAAKALMPSVLQTPTAALSAYKANFADSTIATATTSSAAVPGTYSVEVQSLAVNQRQALGTTYASGEAALDFGSDSSRTLTLTKGGETSTINLDSSQNTLSAVRDAINKAATGVSATIVTDTGGKQNLLLTADEGGTANAVTVGGTATFIDPLGGSPIAAGSAFNQTQAAVDAAVKIQGIAIATSGNTITNAIDGVTLTLTKTGTTNLTVTRDNSELQKKVESFVSAYNSLNSSLKSLTSYNSETKVAGTLNGDASLRSIQSQLRGAITTTPSSLSSNDIKTLSDMGVSYQTDGSLKLDSTKFQKAASSNFTSLATAISAFGSAVNTVTGDLLATGGVISSRTDGLNASSRRLSQQIEALETRLTRIEKNYRAQYTALDIAMTSMSTTSSYLSQQLSILSSMATN